MGKVKIKDIECDAQDMEGIFQSNKLDMSTYLGVPKASKTIPSFWIWIIVPLFIALTSCIWIGIFDPIWTKISIIGVFTLYCSILAIIHYNFKNWSLTAIVAFGGLTLILLSLNVYTPQELAKKIETNTVNKYSK